MRPLTVLLLAGITLLTASLSAQSVPYSHTSNPRELQVFKKAMTLTELGNALNNSGPFTIFAPTDAAFRKMRETEGQDPLQPENRKQLRSLVAYHIVAGELTASRILKALCQGEGTAVFTTVLGEPLIATLEGTDIVLMDCTGNQARIIRADAGSDNLVYHEIDTVVLPAKPGP